MARRRGGRNNGPQARAPELGAGGVASAGLQHGERQAVEDTAAMAPGEQPPAGMPMGGGAPPPIPGGSPWAPTERPGEPITAGLDEQQQAPVLDDDPDEMLRILYHAYPHPDLLDLLRARGD
jgi:hypothetical protein